MRKVNFGCGLSVGRDWVNYDASPTLRIQRIPIAGAIAKKLVKPVFPEFAMYGDVVRGLPEKSGSVGLVYCSHILEHLSLADFRMALAEVKRILEPGGVFRAVLPDLEAYAKSYLEDQSHDACSKFMRSTRLGHLTRPKGFSGVARAIYGNSSHLWMWDYKGLAGELIDAGFTRVRRAYFNDSSHFDFHEIEDLGRWDGCLGFECEK